MDAGQGPGLTLGEEPGTETVTWTIGEMPAHTHDYEVPEPATLSVLFAAGTLLLGWRRRRAAS